MAPILAALLAASLFAGSQPMPVAGWLVALAVGLAVPYRAPVKGAGLWRRSGSSLERILIAGGISAALFRLWLGLPWANLAYVPAWAAFEFLAQLDWAPHRQRLFAWARRAWARLFAWARRTWQRRFWLIGLVRERRWDVPFGYAALLLAAAWLASRFVPHFWELPLQRAHLTAAVWTVVAAGVYAAILRTVARAADPLAENLRWIALGLAGMFLFHGLAAFTLHGTGDARWYAMMLADAVQQVRHGQFPLWAGQSIYQFNGAIYPLRVAPAFHYLGVLLDALTFHSLGIFALQNLLLVLLGLAGLFSAYVTLGRLLPEQRGLAALLAVLFAACPGVLGMVYNTDLFMSWTTVPWIPWVFFATVRSYRDGGARGTMLLLGSALGFCWWGHSPIALWTTLFAALAQSIRVALMRPRLSARAWAWAGMGVLVFLAIAAYPVGSVLFFPPEAGVKSADFQAATAGTIVYFVRQAAPGIYLPLSDTGRKLSDFQLGYALWALMIYAIWKGRASLRTGSAVLLGGAVALLLLLTPIPYLNLGLWSLVPAAVRNITSNWAMNRLYLILAAAIVYGFAAGAASGGADRRRQRILRWALGLGCAWSMAEAAKFSSPLLSRRPDETAVSYLLPENVLVTRFSYLIFPRLPDYFSHGVVDPGLENRLLRSPQGGEIAGDVAAARAGAVPVLASGFAPVPGGGFLQSTVPFPLAPGRSYLIAFKFDTPGRVQGVLDLVGRTLEREYALPEYGEAESFGIGGKHRGFLAVRTSNPSGETVVLRYIPQSGSLAELGAFATATLMSYDPAQLPVRVTSWIPYRAEVHSPAAAWLETPRMFQTGYVARVDGRPAEVRKSDQGLVAVAVPTGASRVELAYQAPLGLQFLFWLSFATGVLVAIAIAFVLLRGLRSG